MSNKVSGIPRCRKCGYRYIERVELAVTCPICKTKRSVELKDVVVTK